MIESVVAENGSRVLRVNGRLLASAFDPEAEARLWLSRRRLFVEKVQSIFVLGAGSGYHLRELLRESSAKIVVIEYVLELAAAVREIHGFDYSRLSWEHPADARALRAAPAVREAIRGSFLVLHHPPTTAVAPEFYQRCHDQLVGRDWGSLNWQWQIAHSMALDEPPKIHAAEPLTIHDLELTELVQNSSERERMLIKALRELVK